MILDIEIGTGRDDILALCDGTPRFIRLWSSALSRTATDAP
jgi:hypothetical protein